MINYRKLVIKDIGFIDKLIYVEKNNYDEFLKIGWSAKQIINQLKKNTNLSFGVFYNNSLISFILGDLFDVEKISEYEMLLLYVRQDFRGNGLATNLLKKIENNSNYLKKIYLEVSENNLEGICFYKKMNFKKIYKRNNYFLTQDIKSDAFVMLKSY